MAVTTLRNPIICAVDTPDMARAGAITAAVNDHVGAIKLGLEFFTANGAAGVTQITQSSAIPLFLDLKFHDIPNTVAKAIASTANIACFMMTVHASGGHAMLQRAAHAADEVAQRTGRMRPLVIAVTMLTSLDQNDLESVGMTGTIEDQVSRLAALSQRAGIDGVVCSPHEIAAIRKVCGPDFKLVVPGIRPQGADHGDQKRVLSPKEALAGGADYLVIGRPITEAPDMKAVAKAIADSLN